MFELYVGVQYCYEDRIASYANLADLLEYAETVVLAPDEEMYYRTPDGEYIDL